MLRAILGVVFGYAVMVVVVMTAFFAAFRILRADGVFQANSFEISWTWIVVSFVLGFAAAVLGGLACALIASPGSKAPLALVAVVLVLGLVSAIFAIAATDATAPAVREGEVGYLDVMQKVKQPIWIPLLNPIVGAAGVLAGARLVRGRRSPG